MANISYRSDKGIGWVCFTKPAPDLSDADALADLADGVATAVADETVQVVAIGGPDGRLYSFTNLATGWHGSDVDTIFGDVCAQIESSKKPVIALAAGTVDLPLVSLMMAAHYRLVDMSFSVQLSNWIGQPSGHTQRLPRLVGADPALRLFAGTTTGAVAAQRMGLVDGLARKDLYKAVQTFLDRRDGTPLAVRPSTSVTAGVQDTVQFYKDVDHARKAAQTRSQRRLVECVEGALLLPFAIGRNFEIAATEELADTAEVRHERRLGHLKAKAAPGPTTQPAPRVCVLGTTDTALEWLDACVRNGIPARLYTPQTDAAQRAGQVWNRRMSRRSNPVPANKVLTADRAVLQADFIINTQSYRTGQPPQAMANLQTDQSTVAFTTAFRPLGQLGAAFTDPGKVLALSLSPSGSLLEWATPSPDDEVVAQKMQTLAAHLKASLVQVAPTGGFLTTRLEDGFIYAIELLLAAGLSPVDIDAALQDRGWSYAPLTRYDRFGLRAIAERQALFQSHLPKAALAPKILEQLAAQGHLGLSKGLGFYDYSGTGDAANPLIASIADSFDMDGLHAFGVSHVADFVVGVLAHFGCRAMGHGFVQSADAVDLAALGSGLVPDAVGGPMIALEEMGLPAMLPRQQSWGDQNIYLRPTTVMLKASKIGYFPRASTT
ncbi:MAG: 3-hydroxyacyl-CoA dehydrogenase family protein [Pseudomonadota bacterium]